MAYRTAPPRSYKCALSYEVRSEQEYFDEIQDVRVTKDMLDLAKHIVNQKSGSFESEKFEDHYATALINLINRKRAGKPITPKERPAAGNVVDLMEALRRSVGGVAAESFSRPTAPILPDGISPRCDAAQEQRRRLLRQPLIIKRSDAGAGDDDRAHRLKYDRVHSLPVRPCQGSGPGSRPAATSASRSR
jgi:hypothetical protein